MNNKHTPFFIAAAPGPTRPAERRTGATRQYCRAPRNH
jgi:hypothetical protein